jgi:hypothetical protein
MRKRLLLVASLGVLAIMPAPASAHGPAPAHPNVGSSLGIRIIARDGPKVVHHYHHAKLHLRPQPWPRRIGHHAPTWRWHGPWPHRRQHFHWRDHEHRPLLRAPRAQHFKHGHAKQWLHAPWPHGAPAARNHSPHARFEHRHARSDRHRHRD